MITQKTIQEIIETVKVEDVVGEYVTLRRRGVNMIGLCPFHNEKTPSFTVSPAKNIYKCFGCGKGGDPIRFMMEHGGLSYPEALRHLANKYGIEIEETKTTKASEEERKKIDDLFSLNQYAADYFIHEMMETDYGKSVGLSYFKKRGFREEIIKKWGLGYAPDKKDHFTLGAINDGFSQEMLKKVGLTSQYGRDFFRGRVMFPIRNLSGKVIGFGGRILAKNAKTAKYLNSPESEVYHKSKVLYGIHFARPWIRKADECIMVEGYTDTLALHQAGIENVVTPCGTSLTEGQILVIKRYTPNITFIFDGDAAGKKAALRGLDMVLKQDMNVRLVLLPEGEDPDSLLQNIGTTKFEEYLNNNKKDFILFKTEHLLEETKGDPIKKTELIKEVIHSIALIPDAIKQSAYVKECAKMTGTDEGIFYNGIREQIAIIKKEEAAHIQREKARAARAKQQKQQQKEQPPFGDFPIGGGGVMPPDGGFPPTEFPSGDGSSSMPDAPSNDWVSGLEDTLPDFSESPDFPPKISETLPVQPTVIGDDVQEQDLVRLLLHAGDVVIDKETQTTVSHFILNNVSDLLEYFDNTYYASIIKEYLTHFQQGEILSSQYFQQHKDKKIREITVGLLISPFQYSPNWEDMLEMPMQTQKKPEKNYLNDTLSSVNRFKLRKVLKLMEKNLQQLKDAKDDNERKKIIKVQMKLTTIKQELASHLGTVII